MDEELPAGWTKLAAPTSTITVLDGQSYNNNNFINYFQGGSGGEPEPEPSPPVLPSVVGGGGGFTARPSVNLSASYPAEKELGKEVLETLVVSNDGNIILTNGVLILDLNEEKLQLKSAFPVWSSFNQAEQKATWQITALAVSGEQSINLTVMPIAQGLAETSGAVVFDQAEDSLIYSEIINPSSFGVGGEGSSTGEGGAVGPTAPTGGQVGGGATTASPTEEASGKEIVVAGEESAPDQEIVVTGGAGAVEGATVQACPVCPWWVWLLAVILHLWTIGAYSFIIKEQASKKGAQSELPFSPPFPWLWLSLVAVSLAIIYILFLTICNFPPLILILPFIVYLAVLAAYHFIVSQKKQGPWPFVPLLVAIGPIAVYLFGGVWAWWIWLLVLGLYVLSVIFYHNAIDKEPNSHAWWWTMLFLTLLVLVLEIAIARHLPL
ncbi:hypothetical protein COZ26_02035 [Candidatus Kuenenbacteria bacterium CG_4_10_14_3_um_filter_39_14]|uniref:Uncharacterized protein n=1 Tax=Candidatus Kuenenbacteria bacterium CG_4_10_14_3_um_filter_39_14 TaxID=1974614 RepID=A0A2M7MH06_9BACT|nr:MAG: hypothetical protein COZ26_02035 [Candidatus Kuenenbacteria bacterium CG_4_10_14_3_um_filter_39_14]